MGRKPKPKTEALNKLSELSAENRRLHEIIAYLNELVSTLRAERPEGAEQSGSAEA
jgi:hypothetical protein